MTTALLDRIGTALDLAEGTTKKELHGKWEWADAVKDARAALATLRAREAEPVAWQYRRKFNSGHVLSWINCGRDEMEERLNDEDWETRALYAAPAPVADRVTVSDAMVDSAMCAYYVHSGTSLKSKRGMRGAIEAALSAHEQESAINAAHAAHEPKQEPEEGGWDV